MHCAAKLADFFGIALIKIYLIGSIVLICENRQKVLNHSNLFLSPTVDLGSITSSPQIQLSREQPKQTFMAKIFAK